MRSPGKQQYYDPFVETAKEQEEVQLQLRGIGVAEPGTYILFDDILETIRVYAFSAEDSKKQQTIYELINWLESIILSGEVLEEDFEESISEIKSGRGVIVSTIDEAERIELYPDADSKWHARLIDKNGLIIGRVNDGSFDRDWVETDAAKKYPKLEIVQLESEEEDSTWTHKGPSKRLWNR